MRQDHSCGSEGPVSRSIQREVYGYSTISFEGVVARVAIHFQGPAGEVACQSVSDRFSLWSRTREIF